MSNINIMEGHSKQTIKTFLDDEQFTTPVDLFKAARHKIPAGYKFITFHFNNTYTTPIETGLFTLFSFKTLQDFTIDNLFIGDMRVNINNFKRVLMKNFLQNFSFELMEQAEYIDVKNEIDSTNKQMNGNTKATNHFIYLKQIIEIDKSAIIRLHEILNLPVLTDDIYSFYKLNYDTYINKNDVVKLICMSVINCLFTISIYAKKLILSLLIIYKLYQIYKSKQSLARPWTIQRPANMDRTEFIKNISDDCIDEILKLFFIQIKLYNSGHLMPHFLYSKGLYFKSSNSLYKSGVFKLSSYAKFDDIQININGVTPDELQTRKMESLQDDYMINKQQLSTDDFFANENHENHDIILSILRDVHEAFPKTKFKIYQIVEKIKLYGEENVTSADIRKFIYKYTNQLYDEYTFIKLSQILNIAIRNIKTGWAPSYFYNIYNPGTYFIFGCGTFSEPLQTQYDKLPNKLIFDIISMLYDETHDERVIKNDYNINDYRERLKQYMYEEPEEPEEPDEPEEPEESEELEKTEETEEPEKTEESEEPEEPKIPIKPSEKKPFIPPWMSSLVPTKLPPWMSSVVSTKLPLEYKMKYLKYKAKYLNLKNRHIMT